MLTHDAAMSGTPTRLGTFPVNVSSVAVSVSDAWMRGASASAFRRSGPSLTNSWRPSSTVLIPNSRKAYTAAGLWAAGPSIRRIRMFGATSPMVPNVSRVTPSATRARLATSSVAVRLVSLIVIGSPWIWRTLLARLRIIS